MKTMKISAIIADFPAFHKDFDLLGIIARTHKDCDVLLALMPGHFDRHGMPLLPDKWRRVESLLENGIDLVVEIPFAYCMQNVGRYAASVVGMLIQAKVDDFFFFSETDNLAELEMIARLPINVDAVKEKVKSAEPLDKSYGNGSGAYYENDILGVAYLKASNGSIPKAHTLPLPVHFDERVQGSGTPWAPYFPFLRWKLLTQDHASLHNLFAWDIGIENHLRKQAEVSDTWEDFLKRSVTRRYTEDRVRRACAILLVHVLGEEMEIVPGLNPLRILGFNDKGKDLLKQLKSKDVRVASRFNRVGKYVRVLEYRSTLAYASILPEVQRSNLLKREIGGPIIKKKDESR
jgi:predicted nucleotidyltransferase